MTTISTAGSLVDTSVTTGQATVSVTTVNVGDAVVAAWTVYGNIQITAVSSSHATWVEAAGPLYNATIGATVHLWIGTVSAAATANVTLTFSGTIGATKVQTTLRQFTAGLGVGCEWHYGAASQTNASASTMAYPSLSATCAEVSYFPYAANGAQASTTGLAPFAYVGYGVAVPVGSAGSTSGFVYSVDTNNDVQVYNLGLTQNSTYTPSAHLASSAVSITTGAILMPYLAGTAFLTQTGYTLRFAMEIAWGANLADLTGASWDWTDVTGDILMNPETSSEQVSITLGSPNNTPGQQTQASEMRAVLLNSGAQYSLGGQSPNWPNVTRNVPVRYRVLSDGAWYMKYQAGVVSLQPQWDVTGRWAVVHLDASGPLRRLNQGTLPVRSVMRNYITSGADSTVTDYWPFEEPDTALINTPLISSMGTPNFWSWTYVNAADNYIPAASPQQTGNGKDSTSFACASIAASMPAQQNTNPAISPSTANHAETGYTGSTAPSYLRQVSGNYVGQDSAGAGSVLWGLSTHAFIVVSGGLTTTTNHVYVDYQMDTSGSSPLYGGRIQLHVNQVGLYFAPTGNFIGLAKTPFRWRLYWSVSGGNTTFTLGIIRLGDTVETTATTTYTGFSMNVASYGYQLINSGVYSTGTAGYTGGGSFGHVAYHNAASSLTAYAPYLNAHLGESVTDRIARLCAENGTPCTILSGTGSETSVNPADTMGAQWAETLTNLLRECEATGQGAIYDGLAAGITYVARLQRAGQQPIVTLDASAGNVGFAFEPVDDDQSVINDVTVTQKNGPAVTYSNAAGQLGVNAVGDYQSSLTINQNAPTATALAYTAQWLVSQGTASGYRYPRLQFALEFNPYLIQAWLTMYPGGRLDVSNITNIRTQMQNATIKNAVVGWTETIDLYTWRVDANCTSYDPWRVITLAAATGSTNDTTCWLDTDGSTLHAAAAQGATSITVDVTSGPRWVTTADTGGSDNFPFSISLGGVQVTVSNVTGTSNPQTFTVSALPQAFPAGVAISIWDPPVLGM